MDATTARAIVLFSGKYKPIMDAIRVAVNNGKTKVSIKVPEYLVADETELHKVKKELKTLGYEVDINKGDNDDLYMKIDW